MPDWENGKLLILICLILIHVPTTMTNQENFVLMKMEKPLIQPSVMKTRIVYQNVGQCWIVGQIAWEINKERSASKVGDVPTILLPLETRR